MMSAIPSSSPASVSSSAASSSSPSKRSRTRQQQQQNSLSPSLSPSNNKDVDGSGSGGNGVVSSFLQKWKRDAQGAVEDAYANWVLGDDPGESARLVLVATPGGGGGRTTTATTNNNSSSQQQQQQSQQQNGQKSTTNSSSTGFARGTPLYPLQSTTAMDNNNNNNNNTAFTELPSTTITSGIYPHGSLSQYDLNASALRDNHNNSNPLSSSSSPSLPITSSPSSSSRSRRRQLSSKQSQPGEASSHHNQHPINVQLQNDQSTFVSCGVAYTEINGRAYVQALEVTSAAYQAGIVPQDTVQYAAVLAPEWDQPFEDDFQAISELALDRESSGQRITFQELKRVLIQQQQQQGNMSGSGMIIDGNHSGTGGVMGNPNHHPLGGATTTTPSHPRPVPTTIRIGKGICGPSSEEYDDDDGDNHGHKNKNTASTGGGGGEMMINNNAEPRPVVLVFRRTRQRPPKVWNMWPNYRLDDECDVACQILQSLLTDATDSDDNNITNGTRSSSSSRSPRRMMISNTSTNNHYDDDVNSTVLDERLRRYDNNIEASTLRGMIQKAVGLAFVRSNKVVFGVSVHGGSGVVVARLPDGTWSAPSAMGMVGMGVGLQVGLEVAQYLVILQTREALEHFQRSGGSFTLGANAGAALAGIGREAIGAASITTALCGISPNIHVVKEDEYTYEDGGKDASSTYHHKKDGVSGVAPIVAYAKSEGLYVGVSLEGSRLFSRDEINTRAYKLDWNSVNSSSTGTGGSGSSSDPAYGGGGGGHTNNHSHKRRNGKGNGSNDPNGTVTAQDILSGKVTQRPPEAERLYGLLHQIELTHEIASLPTIPKCSVIYGKDRDGDWTDPWNSTSKSLLEYDEKGRHDDDNDNDNDGRSNDGNHVFLERQLADFHDKFRTFLFGGISVIRISSEKRERRTLWLYRHEEGNLRIGFVSKMYSTTSRTNLSTPMIQDLPHRSNGGGGGSDSHSMSGLDGDELTLDSALMDTQSFLTTTGILRQQVELSKKLSMDLIDVLSMSQKVPYGRAYLKGSSERRRVISLESATSSFVFVCETLEETRLLYCGLKILLEKETARTGIRGGQGVTSKGIIASAMKGNRKRSPKNGKQNAISGYVSSDNEDGDEPLPDSFHVGPEDLPECWKSWGRVPTRSYLRQQASSNDDGYPTYIHGQMLVRDVCKNVHLPLPLPLCRVLLLDSSSPVISKWEQDRGDADFEKTPWTFPPATPREMEQFQSEHQLIASGSMCGAHRTISYERYRHGQLVRLSETHIVDSDDSEKLAFQVTERLPRRGFSIKVKLFLRAVDNGSACEATVFGEIRPVGRNMSDPVAVHKALELVLEELRNRYGTEDVGLLAGFMSVVENMPDVDRTSMSLMTNGMSPSSTSPRFRNWEEKKEADIQPLDKTSVVKFEDVMNADKNLGAVDVPDPKFAQESRPSTPSPKDIADGWYKPSKGKASSSSSKSSLTPIEDTFDQPSTEPVTIEVKPLPKIRLSLMPSPREEDEENLDEDGEPLRTTKNDKRGKSSSKSSSRTKSSMSSSSNKGMLSSSSSSSPPSGKSSSNKSKVPSSSSSSTKRGSWASRRRSKSRDNK